MWLCRVSHPRDLGLPLLIALGLGPLLWKHLVTCNAVRRCNTAATLYQNAGPRASHQRAQRRGVEAMRVALDSEYLK
jgi:hypothetical protein